MRELLVVFTRKEDYDSLEKPRMFFGENPDGPQVGLKTRLILFYPFFILASGALTIWVGFRIVADIQS